MSTAVKFPSGLQPMHFLETFSPGGRRMGSHQWEIAQVNTATSSPIVLPHEKYRYSSFSSNRADDWPRIEEDIKQPTSSLGMEKKEQAAPAEASSGDWNIRSEVGQWQTQPRGQATGAPPTLMVGGQSGDSSQKRPRVYSGVQDASSKRSRYEDHYTGGNQQGEVWDAPGISPRATRQEAAYGSPSPSRRNIISRLDTRDTFSPQARIPVEIPSMDRNCERCPRASELLQDTIANLNMLDLSLSTGQWLDIQTQYARDGIPHDRIPQIADLHRVLDLVTEASQLAKQFGRLSHTVPRGDRRDSTMGGRIPDRLDSSVEVMRRRFLADPQDTDRRHSFSSPESHPFSRDAEDVSTHDHDQAYQDEASRRASTSSVQNSERLPPMRPQAPLRMTTDSFGSRLPSMKPPPAPGRQQESPRTRNSPSFPAQSYASHSHSHSGSFPPTPLSASTAMTPFPSLNAQPASPTSQPSAHNTSPVHLLPAVAAHTAALQHTVSVKSFALTTLQAEHDKLLSSLSRSKSRVKILDEKQMNSEIEINSLTEERTGLVQRIQELESEVREIKGSRDESRAAAVREGRQYVEIVRMATQLEEKAAKERREMAGRRSGGSDGEGKAEGDDFGEGGSGLVEVSTEIPLELRQLRLEVSRLRSRCGEFENALRKIRDDSKNVDKANQTLAEARRNIAASLDGALGPPLREAGPNIGS